MHTSSFTCMLALLLSLLSTHLHGAFAAPIPFRRSVSSRNTEVTIGNVVERNLHYNEVVPTSTDKRAVLAPPYFMIYDDLFAGQRGPPPAASVKGWNVLALCFLQSNGPVDKAIEWMNFSDEKRAEIKQEYHNAGIQLIISVFGGTDKPTTWGANPTEMAQTTADWVKKYNLDGVDVNYEDFDAIGARNGKAEAWLITYQKALRELLPVGEFLVSHAPIAPWFTAGNVYYNMHKEVGDSVDFYNIQFYNQGGNTYTSCDNLLNKANGKTSLFELAATVPLNKLVIGKPGIPSDSPYGGYMTAEALGDCLAEAKEKGWEGGVMAWQYPNADAAWIQTARAKAFPVSETPEPINNAAGPAAGATTATETTAETATTGNESQTLDDTNVAQPVTDTTDATAVPTETLPVTETPDATETPGGTDTPTTTELPGATDTPTGTGEPEATATETLESVTETPGATGTGEPEATATETLEETVTPTLTASTTSTSAKATATKRRGRKWRKVRKQTV